MVQLPPGTAIKTNPPPEGSTFEIDTAAGGALVITHGRNRKSNITQTDVATSNGVIHVSDKVLTPH